MTEDRDPARPRAALPDPMRQALVAEGIGAALQALRIIRAELDAGTADFDDAVRALPAVHKLIEHAERMETARNTPSQWQPAHFVIVLDPNARQERPARPTSLLVDAAPLIENGEDDASPTR